MVECQSEIVIWARRILTSGAALLTLACGGDGPSGPPEATVVSIEISEPPGAFLNVGAFRHFSAQATYSDGSTEWVAAEAIWISSDTLVMTVHPPATGHAVGVGEADICVWFQNATECRVGMTVLEKPPFGGTILIDRDIITASDITTFDSLVAWGLSARRMYDRRVEGWVQADAYVFEAIYEDGSKFEVLVNSEFGSFKKASDVAKKYGEVLGRIPTGLRCGVETTFIHRGTSYFGGGANIVVIHTDRADLYEADGILEEVLVHEATHTAFGPTHSGRPGWQLAQTLDARFISLYAQEFPLREDLPESFLPYLAVRYRSDRISQSLADTIKKAIPNRIEYLDRQVLDMYPITRRESSTVLLPKPWALPPISDPAGHKASQQFQYSIARPHARKGGDGKMNHHSRSRTGWRIRRNGLPFPNGGWK